MMQKNSDSPEGSDMDSSAPGAPDTSQGSTRVWSLTKFLIVFGVGVGLGFSIADGRGGSRVVYSGAMSEQEGRAVHGPDEAPVTIVEYTDYECSFCRRYNRLILPEILETYEGRIRYIVRHFPLVQMHPAAAKAAEAAVCAEQQGSFWEYHDLLFAQAQGLALEGLQAYADQIGLESDTFQACLNSEEPARVVMDDLERGAAFGVRGTPAFFINGRVVYGAQPAEAFMRTIDAALEEAEGN